MVPGEGHDLVLGGTMRNLLVVGAVCLVAAAGLGASSASADPKYVNKGGPANHPVPYGAKKYSNHPTPHVAHGHKKKKGSNAGAAIAAGAAAAVILGIAANSAKADRGNECRRWERKCDDGQDWACDKYDRHCD